MVMFEITIFPRVDSNLKMEDQEKGGWSGPNI